MSVALVEVQGFIMLAECRPILDAAVAAMVDANLSALPGELSDQIRSDLISTLLARAHDIGISKRHQVIVPGDLLRALPEDLLRVLPDA